MKRMAIVVAVICVSNGTPATAGAIENACLKSSRASGQRSLCGCIQSAANATLTASDQRLAASFFGNPDKAQRIRTSSRRSDEKFWERYRNFGQTASAYCSR